MSYVQLFNAAASLFASVVWIMAIKTTLVIGTKWSALWRSCSLFVSLWYMGLYFALGSGLIDRDLDDVVVFFRFSFPILMLAPPLTFLSLRGVTRELTRPIGHVSALEED